MGSPIENYKTQLKPCKFERIFFYFVIIIVAVMVAIYTQWPGLSSPYVITEDARQHTYWMGNFHNPELFKGDIYVQFDRHLLPLGFKGIYYCLTIFIEPIFAGKLLSVVLYVIAGLYLFKIGNVVQSRYTGLLLFLSFIVLPPHIKDFCNGLPRAFAFPLMIAFFYYLLINDCKKCFGTVLLQILFYPVIFPVCYFALLLVLVGSRLIGENGYYKYRYLKYMLSPMFLLLTVLGYKSLTAPSFLGKLVSKAEIYNGAAFYEYGRSNYLPLLSVWEAMKEGFFLFSNVKYLIAVFSFFVIVDVYFSTVYKNEKKIKLYLIMFCLFLFYLCINYPPYS